MRLIAPLLLTLTLAGCGGAQSAGPREAAAEPVRLLPVDALAGDFVLRQHVTARWGEREDGFDAIVQRREGELSLFGLTPMATVTFKLTYTPSGVSFTNDSGRELPFEPERILLDVQRAFYPWLPGEACADCERRGEVEGFELVETYAGGRLAERRFVRSDGSGAVVLRYEGWGERARAPERVTIHDEALGYTLVIETFEDVDVESP